MGHFEDMHMDLLALDILEEEGQPGMDLLAPADNLQEEDWLLGMVEELHMVHTQVVGAHTLHLVLEVVGAHNCLELVVEAHTPLHLEVVGVLATAAAYLLETSLNSVMC
jgi:hypothetical protein